MTSQRVCEPCFRGDRHSTGFSWCSDCEEVLCEGCDKAHRISKPSKSHQLVDLQVLPQIPETLVDVQFCDKHPGKILDAYCTFHDDVLCQTCVITMHRSCESIKTIEEVSKNIKSSVLFEDLTKALPALLQTSILLKENLEHNREEVGVHETKIKQSIIQLRAKINVYLDNFESSILTDLSKLRDQSLSNLDKEIKDIANITESVCKHQKDLNFTAAHGSDKKLFLLLEKLKHDVSTVETKIQEIIPVTENVFIKLEISTDIESLVSSFASVSIETKPCAVKYHPVIQTSAQVAPPGVKLEFRYFLNVLEKSAITGIETTNDDKLLLCDWQNDKLLIYKTDGTFISEAQVDGDPYGIALLPAKDEAVLTMPNAKNIKYFDTKQLKISKGYLTARKYYAIQVISDVLVVGAEKAIDMISMEGKYLRGIPYYNIVNIVRFIKHIADDTIVFTDSKHVHCIMLNGTKVFDAFCTSEARGVEVDKYGNVYIADKEKKSIWRLTDGGQNSSVILDESDSIGEPLALRFIYDFRQLYVGSNDSKLLAIFNCKWV